jgi:hypothetical protein
MTSKSTRYLHQPESMIGRTFGHLTVVSYSGLRNGDRFYLCTCSCGRQRDCRGADLRANSTIQCTFCSEESRTERSARKKAYIEKAGKYRFGHPLWGDWNTMRRQCIDKSHHGYQYYGALGATLCEEWRSFEDFCKDMGEDKQLLTFLTRIDYTKPFCKENCKWARLEETEKYAKRNERARKQYHAKKNKPADYFAEDDE